MTGIQGDEDVFRCPTCDARQPALAAECRRCRCDLRLVLAIRRNARELHTNCLNSLACGHGTQALKFARRRYELCPDEISRRLVTVALLSLDRFAESVDSFQLLKKHFAVI